MKKGTLSTIICGVIVLVSFIAILFFAAPEAWAGTGTMNSAPGSGIEISQLSDLQSESLYKLCKVWGYAKYRHPSVIDGSLNWMQSSSASCRTFWPPQPGRSKHCTLPLAVAVSVHRSRARKHRQIMA